MRKLFDIDARDYDINGTVFTRNSARGIIIKDKKIALVHSLKYDYYKLPGGGIEQNESNIDAVIRETAEETGLRVLRDSVREYGFVHRIQKSTRRDADVFVQDNYYYFCGVDDGTAEQNLCDYEQDERFTLEFASPQKAIETNLYGRHGHKDPVMLRREARVLKMLIDEGYFS